MDIYEVLNVVGFGNMLLTKPGQNPKKILILHFSHKNRRFSTSTLLAHRALPKCPHGQSAPASV